MKPLCRPRYSLKMSSRRRALDHSSKREVGRPAVRRIPQTPRTGVPIELLAKARPSQRQWHSPLRGDLGRPGRRFSREAAAGVGAPGVPVGWPASLDATLRMGCGRPELKMVARNERVGGGASVLRRSAGLGVAACGARRAFLVTRRARCVRSLSHIRRQLRVDGATEILCRWDGAFS